MKSPLTTHCGHCVTLGIALGLTGGGQAKLGRDPLRLKLLTHPHL